MHIADGKISVKLKSEAVIARQTVESKQESISHSLYGMPVRIDFKRLLRANKHCYRKGKSQAETGNPHIICGVE